MGVSATPILMAHDAMNIMNNYRTTHMYYYSSGNKGHELPLVFKALTVSF